MNAPDFAKRGTVTDEYIKVFIELWTKDAPKFDSKHVRFDNIVFAGGVMDDACSSFNPSRATNLAGIQSLVIAPSKKPQHCIQAGQREPQCPC